MQRILKAAGQVRDNIRMGLVEIDQLQVSRVIGVQLRLTGAAYKNNENAHEQEPEWKTLHVGGRCDRK